MVVHYKDMIIEGSPEEIIYFIDMMSCEYLDKTDVPTGPYDSCMPDYIEN
jgi:hypothetical protein